MKRISIVFLSVSIFLTGCLEPKILDKLGMVVILGYDQLENNRIRGTAIFHQIDPEAEENIQTIISTGFTSKGIRAAGNLETAKKLQSGQMRVVMFHDKIARQGIMNLASTLARDPDVGTMLYLTVGKGETHDLLTHKYKELSNVGTYLFELIKQNVDGESLPSPSLHEVLHDYYSAGKDPLLPYVERIGDEVLIKRLALFHGDKFVGTITARQGFFVKLIRDRYKTGFFETSVDQKPFIKEKQQQTNDEKRIFVTLDTLSSKADIKLVNPDMPKFDVKIKMEADVVEVSEQLNLSEPKIVKALEKELAKAVELEASDVIKRMQKLNSDPIGFGNIYNATLRGVELTRKKWDELYPDAKVNIQTEVKIIHTGTME